MRRCSGYPAESTGADQGIQIAQERGLPVYRRVEDIPATETPSDERAAPGFRLPDEYHQTPTGPAAAAVPG
ncbi:hypothetical protein FMEAI12_2880004 [Parafrankia sp. Ea1.12]|nr:hypothetical protein FMEAI12_2880004 [Parafrankia sp. Ea1.12]